MEYRTYNIEFLKNNKYGNPTFDMVQENGYFYYPTEDVIAKEIISSKESYINWKLEWKKAYNDLTLQIRYSKNNRKNNHKDKSFDQSQWKDRAIFGKVVARRMMKLRTAVREQLKIKMENIKESV